MPLCGLCGQTIPEILHENVTVDDRRQALIKGLLELADVGVASSVDRSELVCTKCGDDLESVEKILARIREEHSNGPKDIPIHSQQFSDVNCCVPFDVAPCSYSEPEPLQIVHSEECNSQNPTTNNELPRKRLRRPPKRYADDDYIKFEKMIQIVGKQKKLYSSSYSCYPKMAQMSVANGICIGDLVEVQHRGKLSRLRILCRQCPEAFANERRFRQHLTKHEQAKYCQPLLNEIQDECVRFLYSCSLCEKSFHEHFTVRRHYKLSHNDDRQHQCQICSSVFKYKTNLDYHKAKHLNHRNHQCPQCPKKFILRYELQIHLRIHTGEKPFRCQICSMRFAHRSNLLKHRQVHRHNPKKIKRMHKICKLRESESDNNETKYMLNHLARNEISKTTEYNFMSDEVTKNANNFEGFPKPSSTQISRNFMCQQIFIPNVKEAEPRLLSSKSDNSFNALDIKETVNSSPSYAVLSNGKSCTPRSTIIPTNEINKNSDHQVVLTSAPNTSLIDFGKTDQNSNFQVPNHNKIPIKPVINILPKNFKIIKIPKISNLKLQNYYIKSNYTNTKDISRLQPAVNNKPGDATIPLTYSTNKQQFLQRNDQIIFTRMNDDTSNLPAQTENKLNKIPVASYVNSSLTEQNILLENNTGNLKIVSLNNLTSHEIITNMGEQTKHGNTVPSDDDLPCVNEESILSNSILENSQCDNINEKHATDKMIYKDCKKLECTNDIGISYLEEINLNQTLKNSAQIPNIQIIESNTAVTSTMETNNSQTNNLMDSSNPNNSLQNNTNSATKSPLKNKISPRSLLKTNSKPLITKIEFLPKLNMHKLQSSLLSNRVTETSSLSYEVKIPKEYKFQCSICWKYFKQKSALTKHSRTHTGVKPYKCNICPKSYTDASNYKKHKMLHIKAADALNIMRPPKAPPSPVLSNVTDPDPDGVEVMQTLQPFEFSSSDSDDEMENYLWQNALQHSVINQETRENIRRNLNAINSAIMPSMEDVVNVAGRSVTSIFSPHKFPSKNLN